ncbi:MAG TPA: FHA domain-containing protein [Pyrinomonadaceae bacterium]|nr:FHA domain-containing protein [Pyrinomonadaceae bacterium]
MANWRENLEKVRLWIDGEQSFDVTENVVKAHQNKSDSELFLQKLLRSIEELLEQEIIRIPNTNKAYVPEKFLVFVSAETDKTLREDKRKFFEQSLSALILERAIEMAGSLELSSKKLNVEIRINAVLQDDEIEVNVSSDNEVIKSKTIEFVRKSDEFKNNQTIEDAGTIDDFETWAGILYRVEIWQSGVKLNEFPIIQRRNTVGRDDAERIANLRLPTENRKISRAHAEINLLENNEIWVTALHKNPTIVSGRALRNGEKAKLGADGEIQIYDFVLKIKFAE